MSALESFRTMACYNRWMNERLYALCAKMSDDERKRDRGAFFKSIHGTFNHLLLGDRVWMGRFTGEPFHVESLDQELYADFDELRAERARTDEHILSFTDGLDESAVEGELRYTSIVDPAERTILMRLALLHFFNHQTHHRGQATALISQAGYDPGVTDLMWLPGLGG